MRLLWKGGKVKLSELLERTNDCHCWLESGAVTVNLANQPDDTDYWHLSDFVVSSRSGNLLVMIPRNLPVTTHADNGWKHHWPAV
jgi:hypothetical protein